MICYIDRWMEFRVNKGENRGVDEHKNNPKYGVYFYTIIILNINVQETLFTG
jgi:hypothetical protein